MNIKFPAILVTVLTLAACGGGGGGSGGGTGPQAPQVYDDANSYFIAKTSTLEKLTAAQKSGNAKSLYANALNEFYMIEKTKAGKTVESSAFLEKGDVVAALVNPSVNPGAIKAADKMPDDTDVINNFIDAATAYDTEMAKHLYSKDNSNLGWKGTYTGTAIVRNVNVDNTENTVSYNWIDKGNATLEIKSASVGIMNSDLKVDTEKHGKYNVSLSMNPTMYYTSVDKGEVKSIQGAATIQEDIIKRNNYTIFNYHVSR